MKLWVDDVRPAPEGYVWCKSVNQTMWAIIAFEDLAIGEYDDFDGDFQCLCGHGYDGGNVYFFDDKIELIDMDHDAGQYASDGGDYIKILDWLEETGRNYPIHIHSMNPVGVENMRRIIKRNGWTEV